MPRYISELCAKAAKAVRALEDIALSLRVIALCLSKDESRAEVIELLEKLTKEGR